MVMDGHQLLVELNREALNLIFFFTYKTFAAVLVFVSANGHKTKQTSVLEKKKMLKITC